MTSASEIGTTKIYNARDRWPTFRSRLASRRPALGIFVKLGVPEVVEVLAAGGLDFVVLDQEHAPFDRKQLQDCILAARANDLPCLVRVPEGSLQFAQQAIAAGAIGIMVPHVASAEQAEAIVRWTRVDAAERGYAGSTRGGGYLSQPSDHVMDRLGDEITLILQVDDAGVMPEIPKIVAMDGVDALFVGRLGVAMSLGCHSPDEAPVTEAIDCMCRAAVAASQPIGLYLSTPDGACAWEAKGCTFFIAGSDHGLLLRGARDMMRGRTTS